MRRARSRKPIIVMSLLILVLAWQLFPFIWMLSTALKSPDEVFTFRWIPIRPTLGNFVHVVRDTPFPRYFANSVFVALVTMVLALVTTTLAGYALSRFRFRGKRTFSQFLLVSQMFPSMLLVIPIFILMLRLGLVNKYPALIITYGTFALPFSTWMLKAYFDTVPLDLEEAAMVDGCTRLQALVRVALPLAAPGIATVALFVFILCWQEYMFALTLTRTTDMRTLTVGLSMYTGQFQTLWGTLMAASVLVTLPVVIGFVYLQKYIVQGLTMGAVKG